MKLINLPFDLEIAKFLAAYKEVFFGAKKYLNLLEEAEKLESDSIQLFNFTSTIKKESLEVKTEVIEHLWKIIISDQSVDQYESSLMRRICGLIYFPDKLAGDIKLKFLK